MNSVVQGIGIGLPEGRLTNSDLERMVETSDEWIVQRTGIKERRIAADHETTSHFATIALNNALEDAGVDPKDLDLIIVGTVTGDMPFPSVSCLVQEAVGATNAGAMDVGAACAGFIYSLATAHGMIVSGHAKLVAVVGADALTKFVDFTDRQTCVLFGDGAGAVILRAEENTDRGLIATSLRSDGSGAKFIHNQYGGSRFPMSRGFEDGASPYIYMAGKETYRFAVKAMGDACCEVLKKAGLSSDQVDLFVPHQANERIIDSATERIGLRPERVYKNVDRFGNMSGASIPVALYEAVQDGRLQEGMVVMTVGFGAGLVWGANLIRW
jgi:3-oxoacyl-[acyl-carrier-protein] synthase-3